MQPRDQLTAKEIRIATLVWEGLTNREIGKIIGTTEQVVKNYLRTAFDKLGVWSRLELALYVASHGGADWAAQRRAAIEGEMVSSTDDRQIALGPLASQFAGPLGPSTEAGSLGGTSGS